MGDSEIADKIIRYLALIFDTGCTKPTDDEVMMNLAYTMAMKSNCICRQVGAVIEGKDGYVVGAGWNDVGEGKISCGLREIKDIKIPYNDKYGRVFDVSVEEKISELIDKYGKEQFCFCFKDEYSARKLAGKIKNIAGENKLPKHCKELIEKELDVKRLEYCEALHAEENAIVQTSKIGGMGLKGGKMYTTSFPCELCAKKIQQVGISEVIYTEPYPGNISEPVYLHNVFSKIKTRQFEGVMPHSYFKLFKVREDQKEWQEMNRHGLVD